ncbi:MAG: hypothetical protein ER33_05020 [Cyanobium sp. CACIAM 14]|nr:MAG: hypothetical protein ER33_05020 [Cyanobium sp. CACIAM 14]
MTCNPLIDDPFVFPRRADNRPGLPRIAYRIGRYDDFVEAMIRRIDASPELAAWTHRDPDDPGIALLEGAAILGDILSFYQEHYANEAFLRTAAWRESIAELVRLTGYRLAPGIGGRATLAFEVRDGAPVIIRKGFPVKLELADVAAPADVQTDAELTAWPHLGRFQLYRQRHYGSQIPPDQNRFELAAADGATDSIALEGVDLKKGDRLLLLPEEATLTPRLRHFTTLFGERTLDQPAEEIVVVEAVERALGRVTITLAGRLSRAWPQPTRAWKLGRSFRHFGANAPLQVVATNVSVNPPATTSSPTRFDRELGRSTDHGSAYSTLPSTLYPLDQEVGDLALGRQVVVTGHITGASLGSGPPSGLRLPFLYALPFAVARRVVASHHLGLLWGNLGASVTGLELGALLAPSTTTGLSASADLRALRLHETRGPELSLRPISTPSGSAFADGTGALFFHGTAMQARPLAGRRLSLSHADGRSTELVCTNAPADFPTPSPDAPRMWPLSFDRAPTPFTRADFDEDTPTVTVRGNLVDASQGRQEKEAVLGNGDGRQSFQTFPLPKAPLTYALSAGSIPPHVPALEIRVNERLWTRVDSFHGRGPGDTVYIVREDGEGRSFVQFGDGETGARLPSGLKNVKAMYRSGVGARGPLKPGAEPTSGERPPGFDKVGLTGIVSGGADREDPEKAREAAPGKVQSLGRVVSLPDYVSETLAIPGVVTATVAWDLHDGVPAVILRVLLEAAREAEFATVRAAIVKAQRCRGPDRQPLVVEPALRRFVFLDLTYGRDPSVRQEDVEAALRASLGLVGDGDHERSGLFGLRGRRIGDGEFASRIEGRLQQVAGVLWCQVTALGLFAAPAPGAPPLADPSALSLPPAPRPLAARLVCAPHELLQLSPAHLTLTASAAVAARECP